MLLSDPHLVGEGDFLREAESQEDDLMTGICDGSMLFDTFSTSAVVIAGAYC